MHEDIQRFLNLYWQYKILNTKLVRIAHKQQKLRNDNKDEKRVQALERVAEQQQKCMARILEICYREFGINPEHFYDAGDSIERIYGST
jgi:hypothetical protein